MLFLGGVLRGRYSWVGKPLPVETSDDRLQPEGMKAGLTGLVQLNRDKLQEVQDEEHYHLYYMQNYSIGMDMDILLKSLFQPKETEN